MHIPLRSPWNAKISVGFNLQSTLLQKSIIYIHVVQVSFNLHADPCRADLQIDWEVHAEYYFIQNTTLSINYQTCKLICLVWV